MPCFCTNLSQCHMLDLVQLGPHEPGLSIGSLLGLDDPPDFVGLNAQLLADVVDGRMPFTSTFKDMEVPGQLSLRALTS